MVNYYKASIDYPLESVPPIWSRVEKFIKDHCDDYLQSYYDSISYGQLESKRWLCEELAKLDLCSQKNIEKLTIDAGAYGWTFPLIIDFVGSWFGYPFIEMFEKIVCNRISKINMYDPDPICQMVTDQYKKCFNPNYDLIQYGDYFDRTDIRNTHLIICTACEHLDDITNKGIHKRKSILILQSNNYKGIDDHINCVDSVDELIEKNQIKKVFYKGEKQMIGYKRFMVIGQW